MQTQHYPRRKARVWTRRSSGAGEADGVVGAVGEDGAADGGDGADPGAASVVSVPNFEIFSNPAKFIILPKMAEKIKYLVLRAS